ncbi:HNH/ENDO VII family nuclease [Ruania alkalisoli]|uniref:HNH/ENDO VII family nuclease n=1 Tax=Ruania alkalisoli TaxID=2779775 RepID=A0A7M1SU92_9MICO|nr:HNH/ENDO VII family nuclease [Ruania alkalisoli]QOR70504.1 HNH/ENDO VII family nuclease [Ruania alkalisoli]
MSALTRNAQEILEAIESGFQRIKRALRDRQRDQAQKIRDDNNRINETDGEMAETVRKTDLPETGPPGSYGYDADGNRLPYANDRPKYDEGQVETVWRDTHDQQVADAESGNLVDQEGNPLDPPGENQVWVQRTDDSWDLVTWEPGQNRRGVWDMGHRPDAKYSDLRDRYLSGEISKDDFLAEYRDPDHYFAEDPGRNQSHMDE